MKFYFFSLHLQQKKRFEATIEIGHGMPGQARHDGYVGRQRSVTGCRVPVCTLFADRQGQEAPHPASPLSTGEGPGVRLLLPSQPERGRGRGEAMVILSVSIIWQNI